MRKSAPSCRGCAGWLTFAVFKTPLPNQKLWNGYTIGHLSGPHAFAHGGWWHDPRILAATGEGLAKEEARAWEGWWNEKIVELVRLSMKQRDALCVLLTGRAEAGFGELVKRIAASKGLEFDMVCLKPAVGPAGERFDSTMHFKQVFLRRLMETYKGAEEIRIYEDRPKHVKGFRDFLNDYNNRAKHAGPNAPRPPIQAEVIQVADFSTHLDPVVEIAEIQHMINQHNEAVAANKTKASRGDRLMIKKTVFFTGYMIKPADTKRLLALASLPPGMAEADLKYHANNIMICPRPCPPSILEKVGGMGSKMKWAVVGTACHENSIWAACLRPVPDTARFHTDNPSPLVVLALRKGAKPIDAAKIKNWQPIPPDKAFEFETTVGEKVLLRIEREDVNEDAYESLFPNKSSKRKYAGDDGPASHGNNDRGGEQRGGMSGGGYHGPRGGSNNHSNNNNNNNNNNHRGGRGGFNNHRGGGGHRGGSKGGNHRGNARGGNHGGRGGRGGRSGGGARHYHSLDDVGTREFGGGASSAMYDDGPGSGQWASSFNSNQSNNNNNNTGGGMEQYY